MHESEEHAALVELFRNHPELAVRLVLRAGRAAMPDGYTLHVADPVHRAPHMAADALVLVRDAEGVIRLAIAVEVQRGVDADKDFRWPLYGWAERERQRCDCCVLIVATRSNVAVWARRMRHGGAGEPVQFIVIGHHEVPRISDVDEAVMFPALAVLSAAFHGGGAGGPPIVAAAEAALWCLPRALRGRYSRLIFQSNRPAQSEMQGGTMQEYQDPPDYPSYGKACDREWEQYEEQMERFKAQLAAATPEQRIQLRKERYLRFETAWNLTWAKLNAKAEVLLKFMAKRGLTITDEQREDLSRVDDEVLLDIWLDRVLTASTSEELFAPWW